MTLGRAKEGGPVQGVRRQPRVVCFKAHRKRDETAVLDRCAPSRDRLFDATRTSVAGRAAYPATWKHGWSRHGSSTIASKHSIPQDLHNPWLNVMNYARTMLTPTKFSRRRPTRDRSEILAADEARLTTPCGGEVRHGITSGVFVLQIPGSRFRTKTYKLCCYVWHICDSLVSKIRTYALLTKNNYSCSSQGRMRPLSEGWATAARPRVAAVVPMDSDEVEPAVDWTEACRGGNQHVTRSLYGWLLICLCSLFQQVEIDMF